MIIACDLSLKRTGIAKLTEDGRLIEYKNIIPENSLNEFLKIAYIRSEIESMIHNCSEMIVEDLYLGINFKGIKHLARLSGAVIDMWIRHKFREPVLYMACHARKLVGIKGNAHKIEVQVFVVKNYLKKFYKDVSWVEQEIISIKQAYKDKRISKYKLKKSLDDLSKSFEEVTGIGEDIADAIILGKAYINERTK